MNDRAPPHSSLRLIRLLLWGIVALAVAGAVAVFLFRPQLGSPSHSAAQSTVGGPFTLIGGDGKPFSSAKLAGKPYVIYFGFTRCGDVCPTTLSRLAKLRKEAGGEDKFAIVFVTIDPANDGPKEVGQYATLFNTPIIGLTGSQAQIDRVKKQYGIFAEPSHHPTPGKEMEHSSMVLLFDRHGKFVTTLSPSESDSDAVGALRTLSA